MSNWPIVRLETLATFKNGLNFPGTSWGRGTKIIGVSDFGSRMFPDYETLDEVDPRGVVRDVDLLAENDILFVRSNGNRELIGRSLLIRGLHEPVSHSGFTIRLRFREGAPVSPRFYAYLFKSDLIRKTLSGSGGGTNINNLNQGLLGQLEVPVPPLDEQEGIAALLACYDDLIANNQRRIALLESMAEEIYREWFVRMRVPASDECGNSGQAELTPLDELGTFLNGYAFDPTELHEEGLPIIKIRELNAGVCADTPRNTGDKIPEKYNFGDGDIVFSWSGSLVVQIWHQGPALINQHLFKVTPAEGVSREFLYFSIKFAIPIFESLTTGATMQHIKRKELRFVKVRVPGPQGMKAFDNLVSPLMEQALRLKQINVRLKSQRDALLPRLISGKLRVEALDIQFPPSMQPQPAEAAPHEATAR
ncbi:MAG: restriction endonuclease subunit S [Roseateles sp.]|nr:restriction endonuclease subunit S [Burkholderiaceae bacterium]